MQHVAGTGLDGMVTELVADTAGQDEHAVARLAPIGLGGAGRTFLVA